MTDNGQSGKLKMVFLIVAPPNPQNHDLKKTKFICTMWESFHVNLSFPGIVVLQKKKKIKLPHPIFAFLWLYLSLENNPVLYLNKFEFPLVRLYLRMICTKFNWNWSAGSGEKKIQKF
jgi:hypothetical protein